MIILKHSQMPTFFLDFFFFEKQKVLVFAGLSTTEIRIPPSKRG